MCGRVPPLIRAWRRRVRERLKPVRELSQTKEESLNEALLSTIEDVMPDFIRSRPSQPKPVLPSSPSLR